MKTVRFCMSVRQKYKKRIVAYTRIEQLTIRLQRMVAEVRKMEFIIVENENRALIVEMN